MGIYYEEDETEADEEYEAWFRDTLANINKFHDKSRSMKVMVGEDYSQLRDMIKSKQSGRNVLNTGRG